MSLTGLAWLVAASGICVLCTAIGVLCLVEAFLLWKGRNGPNCEIMDSSRNESDDRPRRFTRKDAINQLYTNIRPNVPEQVQED